MKLLVDTHVFLWWLEDHEHLHGRIKEALADRKNSVFVSAATVWEIAIKTALKKLSIDGDPVAEIDANGFVALPIHVRHAQLAGTLPRHHDDPFDRMLVAQARTEGLVLASQDSELLAYGIPVLA